MHEPPRDSSAIDGPETCPLRCVARPLRLESFQHPSRIDENALDLGVPLKRRHRVVELFGAVAWMVPRWIQTKLVRRLVLVQPEFADDGFVGPAEGPSQDGN